MEPSLTLHPEDVGVGVGADVVVSDGGSNVSGRSERNSLSVLEQMWRVYTHYSLHGNPLDAEYLPSKQFVNLLRAAGVFESGRFGQEGRQRQAGSNG